MVLLSAQPFELMMLMTMVLVVMVELMKVTNSDDDDVEWNKARALSEPGQGSCISGGGLISQTVMMMMSSGTFIQVRSG